MFLHVCVILFTGGSASVQAGIPTTLAKRLSLARQTPQQGDPPGKVDPCPQQGDPPGKAGPPTGKADPPAQCMLADKVNKRAVCILLECNSCLANSLLNCSRLISLNCEWTLRLIQTLRLWFRFSPKSNRVNVPYAMVHWLKRKTVSPATIQSRSRDVSTRCLYSRVASQFAVQIFRSRFMSVY